MDWTLIGMSMPLLAVGLLATLRICAAAIVLGIALGAVLGFGAMSRHAPVRFFVRAYVDFIRGTPLLIQIFLVFFALPVIGIRLDETWAGIVALAANTSGYIAETVRGGVGSVERGQTEAARSIGMTHPQILAYILLPQALRPI